MIAASFVVRPDFTRNFRDAPWLLAVPLAAVTALIANLLAAKRAEDRRAFLASSAYIAGVLGSVAAGLYPVLLPASAGSSAAPLDIYNAAAPAHSLRVALAIYLLGLAIVSVYLVAVYRVWRG